MSYRARLKEFRHRDTGDTLSWQKAVETFLNKDLREQFIIVQKETFQSSEQFVSAVQAVVPTSNGGGGTVTVSSFPANVATVTANIANIVSFGTALLASNWVLLTCWMFSSNGTILDLRDLVTSPTTMGFSITPPESGTINYAVAPRA